MAEIHLAGITTPLRLHAILKLLALIGEKPRQSVLDLLQPQALSDTQTRAKDSIALLVALGMIETTDNGQSLRLAASVPAKIDQIEVYRAYMQERVMGITNPNAPNNYVFNQFAAWFAVQDAHISNLNKIGLTAKFSEEMYPSQGSDSDASTRAMNDTKFNGWMNWVAFLGWGVTHDAFRCGFVPDASGRLRGVLNETLPYGEPITMRIFMEKLATVCPELDGGTLFEEAWTLSRPNENRSNNISFMLSTGLRVLYKCHEVTLKEMPDSGDLWQLFPIYGDVNRISHIQRGRT